MRSEKVRAYHIVAAAHARGEIVRPTTCENCGSNPPPAKDGRSKIQGHHHEGYDKPLSLQWLCAACHMAVTPGLNTSNQNKGKTHCIRGHELIGSNLLSHDGFRRCRACQRQRDDAYKRRIAALKAAAAEEPRP